MLRAFRAVRATLHSETPPFGNQHLLTRLHVPIITDTTAIPSAGARAVLSSSQTRFISSSRMLKRAVDYHEASQGTGQVFAKWKSQPGSTPPLAESLKTSASSSVIANNRPLSAGTGNAQKFQPLKSMGTVDRIDKSNEQASGLKRTASGLAKVLGGQNAFEEPLHHCLNSKGSPTVTGKYHSPAKGVMPGVFFDENDFDSDIDLDIEDPAMKGTVSYPQLPAASRSVSTPNRHSPTSKPSPSRKVGSLLKSGSPKKLKSAQTPGSSMPLPWSSSPVEQQQIQRQAVPLKDRTNQAIQHERKESNDEKKGDSDLRRPAKRRALPWQNEEEKEISSTPIQKKAQNSLPWNTTASALKERQKQLRDKGKEVKARDEAENNNATLKQRTTKGAVSRVFLSDEQQHVLDLVINQKKSVFYTGSAGKTL